MSEAVRDYHSRRLGRLLGSADDEAFCQLVWAIDLLQGGDERAVRGIIDYPTQVVGVRIPHPLAIHKWALESLINELLVRSKVPDMLGRNPQVDTTRFDGIRRAYNHLHKLENAEYAVLGSPATVFDEMARIAHRQFPWQRGYYHNLDLARSAYLFGGPHVTSHFAGQHGLKVSDFVMAGFAIFSDLMSRPFMDAASSLPEIGLTEEIFKRAISMLALPLDQSRERAAEIRMGNGQTAYLPSILRPSPCILFDGASRVRAPLPALVLARVTDGVYKTWSQLAAMSPGKLDSALKSIASNC